jgi:hypothetical protein
MLYTASDEAQKFYSVSSPSFRQIIHFKYEVQDKIQLTIRFGVEDLVPRQELVTMSYAKRVGFLQS